MIPVEVQINNNPYYCMTPTVRDVMAWLDPPPASTKQAGDGEIFVYATASFGDIPQAAKDSHQALTMRMVGDYGDGNVWVSPTQERMPYPMAPLYAIAGMFMGEKETGKRADWLLWIDDDVLVPTNLCRVLRNVADAAERPFIAVPAYDRYPPFNCCAWGWDAQGNRVQWRDPPESGVHKVATIGLAAALFHRSLFDRVQEPWFVSTPDYIKTVGSSKGVEVGLRPDTFWAYRLEQTGIPIYACCDVSIAHLGTKIPICRQTVSALRKMPLTYPAKTKRNTEIAQQEPRLVQALTSEGARRFVYHPGSKRLVFGMGTGRCGTKSLAHLFGKQKATTVGHEAWTHLRPGDTMQTVRAHLALLNIQPGDVTASVGFYYLWHVEHILEVEPDAKFICLKRDIDETTRSALEWSPGANLWQEHDGSQWVLQPGTDELFPNYPGDGPEEAHRNYWKDYYRSAEALADKYPSNVKVFPIDALNSEAGVREMLTFAGYPLDEQVVKTGIREHAR